MPVFGTATPLPTAWPAGLLPATPSYSDMSIFAPPEDFPAGFAAAGRGDAMASAIADASSSAGEINSRGRGPH